MPQYAPAVKDEMTQKAVELRAKQWSYQRISDELGISRNTATVWINDEHSRRSEHRGEDSEKHLAVYDAIQAAAWEAFENAPSSSLNRSGYLNTIKNCEDSKARITGAEAPKKYQNVGDTWELVFDDDDLVAELAEQG